MFSAGTLCGVTRITKRVFSVIRRDVLSREVRRRLPPDGGKTPLN